MAYVIRKCFDKDVVVSNALIDLYARCGNVVIAALLFDYVLVKDAVSWSVMNNGYRLHGDARGALELFSRIQLSGVSPDAITYLSLLSACSHAGLVEEGQTVFNFKVEDGVSPRTEHYASGKWEDANTVRSIMEGRPPRKVPGFSLVGD
ncbi:hypothetical protein REPUB_Repub09cG0165000 [Reevesia pubescens]